MINTKEVFAGAAAGAAFPPVLELAKNVIEKHLAFGPTLESVGSTVKALDETFIPKIKDHNTALGGNREAVVEPLIKTVNEGSTLTGDLNKVSRWSALKAHYTGKLVEVDDSIKRNLELLQVQAMVDGQETLILTKANSDVVKETSDVAKETLRVANATSDVANATLGVVKDTLLGVANVTLGVANVTLGVAQGTFGMAKATSVVADENLAVTKETSVVAKQNLGMTTEALLIAKETAKMAKETQERQNAIAREAAKMAKETQERQNAMFEMMRGLEIWGLGEKVESLNEAAALGATLQELADAVKDEIHKIMYPPKIRLMVDNLLRLRRRTSGIFELINTKRAQNKEISYIRAEELCTFRVQIEEGVKLVRNCSNVVEWTDDLKSEYTNKFLHLERTLERLYNRLDGIHPFTWNTGKCGSSCTSGSVINMDGFSRPGQL